MLFPCMVIAGSGYKILLFSRSSLRKVRLLNKNLFRAGAPPLNTSRTPAGAASASSIAFCTSGYASRDGLFGILANPFKALRVDQVEGLFGSGFDDVSDVVLLLNVLVEDRERRGYSPRVQMVHDWPFKTF